MRHEALVVDASVVLEYIVRFDLAPAADRVFRSTVEDDLALWAPDLIYTETLAGLRRLVLAGGIRPREARRAVGWLGGLPVTITGTAGLLPAMWLLAGALTVEEAAYAALANRLDVPLITADETLAEVLRGRRRKVISLSELREGLRSPDGRLADPGAMTADR